MAATNPKNELIELDIIINRKMFYKNNWGIYAVTTKGEFPEQTVIVGAFDREFFPGEEYTIYAEKEYNEKYRNVQYKVYNIRNQLNTPNQVRAFLFVCTKNEKVVDQLIEKYGTEVIEMIADNKVDHTQIKGLGKKTLASLREKVLENLYMKEIIGELAQYDITPTQMKKIMNRFGSRAVSMIKENPYNLCKVKSIGFKKADAVAHRMGVDKESPFRIRAAISYVLEEAQKQGHTWMDRVEAVNTCAEMLGISRVLVESELVNLDPSEVMIVDGNKLALTSAYLAEKTIAERIFEISRNNRPLDIDVDAYVKKLRERYPTITDEQVQIFYNFVNYNLNLLVGNAGCGKSFVTSLLLEMVRNKSVLLLAPTGKAAKIIEEYAKMPASTIHRAIGIWGTDEDDDGDVEAEKESYHDIVVVDETSMCDIWVASRLLKALKNPNVRILFVGDDFQLPSVGAGNILRNFIESDIIKTVKLTKVFRQEEGGVLDIATKVRKNVKFIENDFELNLPVGDQRLQYGNDLVIHPCTSEVILDGVVEYYKYALSLGYTPDDIVVISPMRINKLGTATINKIIQEIVNPESPNKKQIIYGKDEKTSVKFRVGDRVINTKNNYNALNVFDQKVTVYNGDVGVIKDIDEENGVIYIDYGFDTIKTQFKNLNTIAHAYALTIHRMQGSAAKCIIMLTDRSQKHMLNANLIYTGITRTRDRLFWLCQPDVINHAMNKNMPEIRNTFLGDFLKCGVS